MKNSNNNKDRFAKLTWETLESDKRLLLDSSGKGNELHYGCFAISPFEKGEAEIIGKALKLGMSSIKNSFIKRVTFKGLDLPDGYFSKIAF